MKQQRKCVIGCDPDMSAPSFALYDITSKEVVAVHCISIKHPEGEKSHLRAIRTANAVRGCFHHLLGAFDNEIDLAGVCVESQEVASSAKRGVPPTSILPLGWVAGMVLAEAAHERVPIFFPLPNEWKGDVPKHIHQPRILGRLGWEYEVVGTGKNRYARPVSPPVKWDGGKAAWKHMVDAIGLAMYGANQIESLARRSRRKP